MFWPAHPQYPTRLLQRPQSSCKPFPWHAGAILVLWAFGHDCAGSVCQGRVCDIARSARMGLLPTTRCCVWILKLLSKRHYQITHAVTGMLHRCVPDHALQSKLPAFWPSSHSELRSGSQARHRELAPVSIFLRVAQCALCTRNLKVQARRKLGSSRLEACARQVAPGFCRPLTPSQHQSRL